eukprot:scpid85222/ scgid32197/ 
MPGVVYSSIGLRSMCTVMSSFSGMPLYYCWALLWLSALSSSVCAVPALDIGLMPRERSLERGAGPVLIEDLHIQAESDHSDSDSSNEHFVNIAEQIRTTPSIDVPLRPDGSARLVCPVKKWCRKRQRAGSSTARPQCCDLSNDSALPRPRVAWWLWSEDEQAWIPEEQLATSTSQQRRSTGKFPGSRRRIVADTKTGALPSLRYACALTQGPELTSSGQRIEGPKENVWLPSISAAIPCSPFFHFQISHLASELKAAKSHGETIATAQSTASGASSTPINPPAASSPTGYHGGARTEPTSTTTGQLDDSGARRRIDQEPFFTRRPRTLTLARVGEPVTLQCQV